MATKKRSVRMVTQIVGRKVEYYVYEISGCEPDDLAEVGLLVWYDDAPSKNKRACTSLAREQSRIARALHDGTWAPAWCEDCGVAIYDTEEGNRCYPCSDGTEAGTRVCNESECTGPSHSMDCNLVLPYRPPHKARGRARS